MHVNSFKHSRYIYIYIYEMLQTSDYAIVLNFNLHTVVCDSTFFFFQIPRDLVGFVCLCDGLCLIIIIIYLKVFI
jgi:hypothetical protein